MSASRVRSHSHRVLALVVTQKHQEDQAHSEITQYGDVSDLPRLAADALFNWSFGPGSSWWRVCFRLFGLGAVGAYSQAVHLQIGSTFAECHLPLVGKRWKALENASAMLYQHSFCSQRRFRPGDPAQASLDLLKNVWLLELRLLARSALDQSIQMFHRL